MLNKVSKGLAIVVACGALLVMAGWFLHIGFLTSVRPEWVSMKFITALCFLLSAVILFFVSRCHWLSRQNEELLLLSTSFLVFLIMTLLAISTFMNITTGLENLFVQEAPGAVNTVVPGRPALVSMICFVLIAICGLVNLSSQAVARAVIRLLGLAVAIFGLIAVFGYALDLPILYYNINTQVTAIAFNSAIYFCCLGAGLMLADKTGA